jgi:AraC-like DNA-binding protein
MFQVADSVDELVSQRENVVLVRRSYALFFVDPLLAGYFVWGSFDEEDAQRGMREYRALVDAGPSALYADYSRLEHLDPAAIRVAADTLARRLARHCTPGLRQAVVHPSGPAGPAVAGFFDVFRPEFAYRAFARPCDALEWLERTDASAAIEAIDRSLQQTMQVPIEVRRLRRMLHDERAFSWTLGRAAKSLALSKRTLQLRLTQAGSSFRDELANARLAVIKERLRRADEKLCAIALESGFVSPQHFSRWFRNRTGVAPSEYRRRLVARDDAA